MKHKYTPEVTKSQCTDCKSLYHRLDDDHRDMCYRCEQLQDDWDDWGYLLEEMYNPFAWDDEFDSECYSDWD